MTQIERVDTDFLGFYPLAALHTLRDSGHGHRYLGDDAEVALMGRKVDFVLTQPLTRDH
jgi:hypothetical protein